MIDIEYNWEWCEDRVVKNLPQKTSHSWCSISFAPKHLNVFPRNQTNLHHIPWASGICIPKVVLENTSQTKPISCSISIDTDLFVGFNRNRGPTYQNMRKVQGEAGRISVLPMTIGVGDHRDCTIIYIYIFIFTQYSEKIKHNESKLSNVCIY